MGKASRPVRAAHSRPDKSKVKDGAFPIVGIGMSAGGLEAVIPFLNAMPADSGMGFVLVQHLEPTRTSMLAELLGKQTRMPVVDIEDGMRVEPNRVHVIIPAKTLLIKDGVLRLVEPEEPRSQRHPIDKFFAALAEDQQARAIGIVLTGAGSNGTAGLLAIKQGGGLCIAQDPETAAFDSMPRHAIGSGAVDYVLAPDKMPEALLAYAQHPYLDGDGASETLEDGSEADLNDVMALLRARSGQDFRRYKPNTLLRRTHRRMGLVRIERLDDYLAMLRENPAELDALVRDLMINVTAFFRDPEAWEALDREAITPIIAKAVPGQAIRAWVPACSTGEEAYSIAMLLTERAEAANKRLEVKVFATDPGEHNLVVGRKGVYPASVVENLSPERLARFFDRAGEDYRVKPEIRETVLFAPQNLLTDPPYSKMDLVSCRNLLIYLQPEAQERVLALAHFALRDGGFLFLGNAETIGRRDNLFATVSKRWRIYRRAGGGRSSPADFIGWPAREAQEKTAAAAPRLADIAVKALAERFGPASVVIDRHYKVHHFHGATDTYLAQPSGAPTRDLLTLARDGLRLAVRRAVQKAVDDGGSATVETGRGGRTEPVAITASSLDGDDGETLFLVSFAGGQTAAHQHAPSARAVEHSGERDFEEELKTARDELHSTIEQFETANEELKAVNEEATSVNEELQATNEELEASKEELQSLNEELNAVNAQLERKVHELEEAGDDLRNLLAGNEIATIFLDARMRIKWFTPTVQELFDLVEQDVGRPLANFAQKFADGDLIGKARAAIERLATYQEEVKAEDGKCFLLRVQPYRTRDNRIAGAVASFIDITELKASQARIAEARDYAEAIVRTVHDPLIVLDTDLRVQSANPAFYKTFQVSPAETEGRLFFELGNGQWNNAGLRLALEKLLPQQGQVAAFEIVHEFPAIGPRRMLLNANRIAGYDDRPDLILIAIDDASIRLDAERHQAMLVGELSHRVKNTLAVIQGIATRTMRNSESLAAFNDTFLGRIHALGRAHDMILNSGFRTIELGVIIDLALKPFQEGGQIRIASGPAVWLGHTASQSITMFLHELATNAVKYGALSVAAGEVAIGWRLDGDGDGRRVVIDWVETDGPAVNPSPRAGQGTRLIEGSVAHELHGTARLEFAPAGLRAVIDFPLKSTDTAPDSRPSGEEETVR
jgi:two-component system CheB/CheR fusion protein